MNENYGVSSRLYEWFGWDEKKVSFLIQVIRAILLELTAIGLYIASEEISRKINQSSATQETSTTQAKEIVQSTPQKKVEQNKKETNTKRKVTDVEVTKYRRIMLQGKKTGDKAPPYREIISKAGLSDYQGKEIMKILKENGEIKVEGGRTIIT